MSILGFITDIFNPVAKVIDDLTLSPEEKMKLEIKMAATQNAAMSKMLDYDRRLLDAQTSVIKIEAKGNWLQKSWRPITMLTMLALVILQSLGLLSNPLPEWFGTLFQIGLGGYVIGRSAEKIAPSYFKKK